MSWTIPLLMGGEKRWGGGGRRGSLSQGKHKEISYFPPRAVCCLVWLPLLLFSKSQLLDDFIFSIFLNIMMCDPFMCWQWPHIVPWDQRPTVASPQKLWWILRVQMNEGQGEDLALWRWQNKHPSLLIRLLSSPSPEPRVSFEIRKFEPKQIHVLKFENQIYTGTTTNLRFEMYMKHEWQ